MNMRPGRTCPALQVRLPRGVDHAQASCQHNLRISDATFSVQSRLQETGSAFDTETVNQGSPYKLVIRKPPDWPPSDAHGRTTWRRSAHAPAKHGVIPVGSADVRRRRSPARSKRLVRSGGTAARSGLVARRAGHGRCVPAACRALNCVDSVDKIPSAHRRVTRRCRTVQRREADHVVLAIGPALSTRPRPSRHPRGPAGACRAHGSPPPGCAPALAAPPHRAARG